MNTSVNDTIQVLNSDNIQQSITTNCQVLKAAIKLVVNY